MNRTRITSLGMKGVSHTYDGKEFLLNNISLELPLGKTLVLEGEAGSGKSLLLRIMAGLVEPVKGDVFYNGLALSQMSFEDFVPLRTSTAIGFESGGLLMNKTLQENIKLGLLYNNQWRAERSSQYMNHLVEIFEIGKFINLRPASVSPGVRKVAGLIRALVSNPQILFLDDPSLGMSEKGCEALKSYLKEYRREGKSDDTLVMTCSDPKFVESLSSERVLVKDGSLSWLSEKRKGAA